MRFREFLFSTTLVMTTLPAPAHASVEKAQTVMKELVELSRRSKELEGKSDAEVQKRIKAVSAEIDFQALARKSFGARWNKFSAKDRQEFLKTLQDLLEVVAYPNARKVAAKPEDLAYSGSGSQVKVTGHITREKNGEVVQQTYETTLVFDPKSDRIVDAVFEDEVFSENLKRQFNEALKKQTFATIIQKMKKRVDDARK